MKVHYDRENTTVDVKAKNVKDMLKEMNILKNSVIVVVNKEVVTDDYQFKKDDIVKILSVVSGG